MVEGLGHGPLTRGVWVHGSRRGLRRERLDPPVFDRLAEVVSDGRRVGVHVLGSPVPSLPGEHAVKLLLLVPEIGEVSRRQRHLGARATDAVLREEVGVPDHHHASMRGAVMNATEDLCDPRRGPGDGVRDPVRTRAREVGPAGAPVGSEAESCAQVPRTVENPMSLPPMVTVTRSVPLSRASNCAGTVPWAAVVFTVLAPEQLTSVSANPALLATREA